MRFTIAVKLLRLSELLHIANFSAHVYTYSMSFLGLIQIIFPTYFKYEKFIHVA